jgi:hypothetical protein
MNNQGQAYCPHSQFVAAPLHNVQMYPKASGSHLHVLISVGEIGIGLSSFTVVLGTHFCPFPIS